MKINSTTFRIEQRDPIAPGKAKRLFAVLMHLECEARKSREAIARILSDESPSSAWLSLSEAAEMTGQTYEAIRKAATRESKKKRGIKMVMGREAFVSRTWIEEKMSGMSVRMTDKVKLTHDSAHDKPR